MKKAHIFVLAGQSNAVGVGFTKYLPEHFDQDTIDLYHKGFENIPIWYVSHDIKSEGFVPTRINCTEATKDTLGPEVGMAHLLSKTHPDEVYYIIKCAVGGSDLHNGWRSPSSGVPYFEDMVPQPANAIYDPAYQFPGWCFNACMKLLTESFATLKAQGFEPCVEAFCWMQGESDTHISFLSSYMGWYDALLHDLKTTFAPAFDHCTFIDAGISQVWENYEQMNAQKKAYAAAHGHKFIDTIGAGLTTLNEPYEEPDTYHYDVCSALRLGELFMEAWENR